MSNTYRIDFTPSGPYFFGNEKRFAFSGSKDWSPYYISGEATPSQTTLFGALRYLLLKNKGWGTNRQNDERIGCESFDPAKPNQTFGVIKGISPLFIYKKDTKSILLPTPKDCFNNSAYQYYYPFVNYSEIQTSEGTKFFAEDYDSKRGLTSSWFDFVSGKIFDFDSTVRVGINVKNTKDGFFKRKYSVLKDGYSFSFYAKLDLNSEEVSVLEKVVLLGQGHTPFSVTITSEENKFQQSLQKSENWLTYIRKYKNASQQFTVYCMSDTLFRLNPYEGTMFAAIDTRDYRAFSTSSNGNISNGELHRLVRGGSIFVFKSKEEANNWIDKHKSEHLSTVGMNQFIKLYEGEKSSESTSV